MAKKFLLIVLIGIFLGGSYGRATAFDGQTGQPEDATQSTSIGGMETSAAITTPLGKPGTSYAWRAAYGVSREAFLEDGEHIYAPVGLLIDGDSLYVAEEAGQRLLRIDLDSGEIVKVHGEPGFQDAGEFTFNWPRDVAKDADGNLWVAEEHVVKKVSPGGERLYQFPTENPWASGAENDRFNQPRGLAFGADGRLYVADSGNQRVQIFSLETDGSLVYDETIGVTGETGDDSNHFNYPYQLALDGSGRLYVTDNGNGRVQRCTKTSDWSCETFYSGLTNVGGITVHGDDVFFVDSAQSVVYQCDLDKNCDPFAGSNDAKFGKGNNEFFWAVDVAVDGSGNVYVSDVDNFRVQKFNSTGDYQRTYGVTGVPYITDQTRLNAPFGVAALPDGGVAVVEKYGLRVVKLDENGAQEWVYGTTGIAADGVHSDRDHSLSTGWWYGLEGNPAVDAAGNIYVPDPANYRIIVLDGAGNKLSEFGEYGDGNAQFDWPTGVGISPVNGDIFVADQGNHRVQVFNANWQYKNTIGMTDQSGADNTHFSEPRGVAISKTGAIYISDAGNHRVQKCQTNGLGYTCGHFVGVTGEGGSDLSHLGYPTSVAVDAQERVYIVNHWDANLLVFDAQGGYLATIGGGWGWDKGQWIGLSGVSVGTDGTVYGAASNTMQVVKYVPTTGPWVQQNITGFGENDSNIVWNITQFKDALVAGTHNGTSGGQLWWRSKFDGIWHSLPGGFGDSNNLAIESILEFNGKLFAGTYNKIGGAQLRYTSDLSTWHTVTENGFGDLYNFEVFHLAEINNQICATTWTNGSHGSEIWCSPTGLVGSWTRVVENGFGEANNYAIGRLIVYENLTYASTLNDMDGGQIWRRVNGIWTKVFTAPGRGIAISDFEITDGWLYASVFGNSNTSTGPSIVRCQQCDGSDWQTIPVASFSSVESTSAAALEVYKSDLYFVLESNEGLIVYRSEDGINWDVFSEPGFGQPRNALTYWGNAVSVVNDRLVIGVGERGEVWAYDGNRYSFLPMIVR